MALTLSEPLLAECARSQASLQNLPCGERYLDSVLAFRMGYSDPSKSSVQGTLRETAQHAVVALMVRGNLPFKQGTTPVRFRSTVRMARWSNGYLATLSQLRLRVRSPYALLVG